MDYFFSPTLFAVLSFKQLQVWPTARELHCICYCTDKAIEVACSITNEGHDGAGCMTLDSILGWGRACPVGAALQCHFWEMSWIVFVCSSSLLIKFADDSTLIGIISNNNEVAYREETITLAQRYQENNLSLNVMKTKQLVVDYRRNGDRLMPITINESGVERVNSFRFLGIHVTEDHTWSVHTGCVEKKAQQHLFHLK
ncbi:uncharacterized protein si:ch1073-145m9.1 isoform X2 [Hypanus sabinus]|uniref:uncharacterized protein si:ch1073-145m9.1 isoform X2 n=1 Tax=Hypanus sabinus TaxID=79690 RepID=UPI0028C3F8AF|nr:uncharacterized protein si:ch1073-145m9.1 isoform X2 [Hypanus sabinus]